MYIYIYICHRIQITTNNGDFGFHNKMKNGLKASIGNNTCFDQCIYTKAKHVIPKFSCNFKTLTLNFFPNNRAIKIYKLVAHKLVTNPLYGTFK